MSEARRTCGRCGVAQPLSAFSRRGTGHQAWCKQCFRAYFRERGDLHRRQSNAALEARRKRAQRFVLGVLAGRACVDCGEADPVVLEFDHVGAKTGEIAQLVRDGVRLTRLRDEISRCEVVCACCHRWRTELRRRSWRVRPGVEDDGRRAPQLALVRDRLAGGCVDCGRTDLPVLEFDHVGPKRASVMVMAWAGWGQAELLREMDACVVRCCNCHRRRTAAQARHYRHSATMSIAPP